MNKRCLKALGRRVNITFPNGETWACEAGPTAELTKAVIEVFAPRFLLVPAVVRATFRTGQSRFPDDHLCESLGFHAAALKEFPEVVLADASPAAFKIVFVSVVTTPTKWLGMTITRKQALASAALATRLDPRSIHFVSVFSDRGSPAFRKLVSELAWGTCVWFTSEPRKLLLLVEAPPAELPSLLQWRELKDVANGKPA